MRVPVLAVIIVPVFMFAVCVAVVMIVMPMITMRVAVIMFTVVVTVSTMRMPMITMIVRMVVIVAMPQISLDTKLRGKTLPSVIGQLTKLLGLIATLCSPLLRVRLD